MIKNKKIAWIEDDIGIIKDVVQPLINEGYIFTYLRSVKDTLDNINTLKTVDLILLDLIIPAGEDKEDFQQYPGVDLLEKLRNNLNIETPVVVFTVVTSGQVYQRLHELGVVEIVNKPIRPSTLKEIVEQILNK